MNSVKIDNIDVAGALELKYQLVQDGLKQPDDFEWQFTPREQDWMNGTLTPSSVEFKFFNSNLASFYRLKWA